MVGIQRLSIPIMSTILFEVNTRGKSKRTNLALYARIPYDRFKNYLNVMILLELLILEVTTDGIFVKITELGRKFLTHY